MSVPPQHFPVFVTCNQRDLLYSKPYLKETAPTLMSQIIEMQILDL